MLHSHSQIIKAPGIFTEQIRFFRARESFGSFNRLNTVPIHVAVRIVAGVHEPLAAELVDDRAQVLVAFKAAQNSAFENVLTGRVDRGRQLVRFSSPIALFPAGARFQDMLDLFYAWRCLNCGEIVDPVVAKNRGMDSKKPKKRAVG